MLERRDDKQRTSLALWLPAVYFFIVASRPVSAWFGGGIASAQDLQDGSPLDAAVYAVLYALAAIVLVQRRARVMKLLRRQLARSAFLFVLLDQPDLVRLPFGCVEAVGQTAGRPDDGAHRSLRFESGSRSEKDPGVDGICALACFRPVHQVLPTPRQGLRCVDRTRSTFMGSAITKMAWAPSACTGV